MMHVLVLSGGGARGYDQIGRCRALFEMDPPAAIVGTSVGAINAFLISHLGPENAYDDWVDLRGIKDVARRRWYWPFEGYYDLRKPLGERLTRMSENFSPSLPYYCCSIDLRTFEASYKSGVNAVLRSSVMPVIHYIPTEDKWHIDGGARHIAPTKFAIEELQASRLTVIVTSPAERVQEYDEWKPPRAFRSFAYLLRTIDAMTTEVLWNDLKLIKAYNNGVPGKRNINVRVIAPKKPVPIGVMEFDPRKGQAVAWDAYKETLGGLLNGDIS